MSRIPFIQDLKDALVAKLGGATASDFASVDHRRQIAEGQAEPITSDEPTYSMLTENPTPIPRLEDGEAYKRAVELQQEMFHVMTLNNTPYSHIGVGSDDPADEDRYPEIDEEPYEKALDEWLIAHPELKGTKEFGSYYQDLQTQGQEQGTEL